MFTTIYNTTFRICGAVKGGEYILIRVFCSLNSKKIVKSLCHTINFCIFAFREYAVFCYYKNIAQFLIIFVGLTF